MEVKVFEEFINDCRKEFRQILDKYHDGICTEYYTCGITDIVKKMFDKCCSAFEEQTLAENLKDEFQNYLTGFVTKDRA